MTKRNLAEQILETVYNSENKQEGIDGIISLLDVLEPKNKERFSEWGYPEDKSTPEKCWD
ncbi:hypothetical protein SAMN04487764_1521 [Gillisia sp. Hel1_33_143]|uniref:hypothetical protein n=1 Tax=Gillisia sp. Hel1_33_143 TaxID=1336796 RepID=UPI00087CDBBB|nr:hypothetical protein [Gillisia sp. Hel1_33_143]SDS12973.1 hypothetical protein SAMN04487764_1521 [Gillisia sp. Hel1_33_143]